MKKIVLESPYAGDVELNTLYARHALKDALNRGESPIASHLLLTQPYVLDDTIPHERAIGIDAGLVWLEVADAHVFYIDLGISQGMQYALDRSLPDHKIKLDGLSNGLALTKSSITISGAGRPVVIRSLGLNQLNDIRAMAGRAPIRKSTEKVEPAITIKSNL